MLSINLVTYNSLRYLPFLFSSLEKQVVDGMVIRIMDNASKDNTVEWILEYKKNSSLAIDVHTNDTNVGFAKAHNQLLAFGNEPYVMFLNHDVFFEEECVAKLCKTLEQDESIGMVSPRLMKWDETTPDNKGSVVDSLGLYQYASKRVVEIGAGKPFSGKTGIEHVFGVSATAAIIRRQVIERVTFSDGTLFDELYVSYKEDVDLAWRLHHLGIGIAVHYDAVAYHDRTAADGADKGDVAKMKNKRIQSDYVRYHSYKNHVMTLYKNLSTKQFFLDFFPIFWYEGKKFCWFLFFDRSVLRGLIDMKKHWPEIKDKRTQILGL